MKLTYKMYQIKSLGTDTACINFCFKRAKATVCVLNNFISKVTIYIRTTRTIKKNLTLNGGERIFLGDVSFAHFTWHVLGRTREQHMDLIAQVCYWYAATQGPLQNAVELHRHDRRSAFLIVAGEPSSEKVFKIILMKLNTIQR